MTDLPGCIRIDERAFRPCIFVRGEGLYISESELPTAHKAVLFAEKTVEDAAFRVWHLYQVSGEVPPPVLKQPRREKRCPDCGALWDGGDLVEDGAIDSGSCQRCGFTAP